MTGTAADDRRAPVITIDGPTASGKGTVAGRVAASLGWHVLDSGALYRLTALAIINKHIDPEDVDAVAVAAHTLDVVFSDGRIVLDGVEVGEQIRQEHVGNLASCIAGLLPVRHALLDRQRRFCREPGLVADGRDMGTVVFPDASLKVFLIADVNSRAQRRYKQLKEKGFSANLAALLTDMRARDERDRNRVASPLVAAADAYTVDSSQLSIDETVKEVLDLWSGFGARKAGQGR